MPLRTKGVGCQYGHGGASQVCAVGSLDLSDDELAEVGGDALTSSDRDCSELGPRIEVDVDARHLLGASRIRRRCGGVRHGGRAPTSAGALTHRGVISSRGG